MKRAVSVILALTVAIGLNVKPGGFGASPAHPATALAASCPYSPTVRPKVSVDNSATTIFNPGDPVTIRGSGYQCSAPLSLTISIAGQTTSLPSVQVTTDSNGSFQAPYNIPSGPFTRPYPITIKVYDVYANLLTDVTLHSCQEAGGASSAPCGPQTLIQDANNYHTLQPLEQNAEQEIADLRGIANDTTNVYFSRGEIRADMLVNLTNEINACGASMSTCASPSDLATVQYYANAVKQQRVDVANLAYELDNGPNGNVDQSFCLPEQPSSCGWYSWHHNASSFLIPVGAKATECGAGLNCGPDSSDSNQKAWTSGNGILPPSFQDFTGWAAAAMSEVQTASWGQALMQRDSSYTSLDAAVTQVRKELTDAFTGFQEGDAYLTARNANATGTLTPAEQSLQVAWTEIVAAEGEKLAEPLAEMLINIGEVIAAGAGSAAAEAGIYAAIIVVAVIATVIAIFVSESNTTCALQDALNAANSDNLYNDLTGQASYTDCTGATVSMSKNDGLTLLFGALVASTMPDFESLRSNSGPAGPAQPSDPVFMFNEGFNAQSADNLPLSNWGDPGISTVSVANGWFIVRGQYQPDFEYKFYNHGALFRAWLNGDNSFIEEAAGYNAGQGILTAFVNACPGFLGPPGSSNTVVDNGCILSNNSDPGCGTFQWCFFVNSGDEIVFGNMPSLQDFLTPGSTTNVSHVTSPCSFCIFCGSLCPYPSNRGGLTINPALNNGPSGVQTVYVLTQPNSNCADPTKTSLPQYNFQDCLTSNSLFPEFIAQCTPGSGISSLGDACGLTSSIHYQVRQHRVQASDDTYSLNSSGQVLGNTPPYTSTSPYNGVLANDGPSSQDQQWLQSLDVPAGNVQLAMVAGPAHGTLNLTVSGSPFKTTGVFQYTSTGSSGTPGCIQIPVPATTSPGYQVCGGPTGDPNVADSFIYQLCYSVIDWVGGSNTPNVCSYARVSIDGTVPTFNFPPHGTKIYGNPPFTMTATSNSPGTITYSTGTASVGCTVDPVSGTVTITGAAIGTSYCIITATQAPSGSFLGTSATQQFHILQAPLKVTASHSDITYDDAAPTSFTIGYSGFVYQDTQTSVVGSNGPTCNTTYQQGNVAASYPINCTFGSLSSPNYTFVSGYSGTLNTALNPDSGAAVQLGTLKVVPATIIVTAPNPSVQYSDPVPSLAPSVSGFVGGQTASTVIATMPTCSSTATTGTFSNAAGTQTTTNGDTNPAGQYTITCSGGSLASAYSSDYTFSYQQGTLTVTQENATVQITSSQAVAPLPSTGSATIPLTATVWDSAANAYTGTNPESGSTATIGAITRMYVEFDIYQAGSCLSGTPAFSPVVQVSATGTPGVGTAGYNFSQSQPGSFCVVPRVVGPTAGSTNGYYTAPDGPVTGIAFYINNGQFVTGGGHVPDAGSSNGVGNFGFEAHYNANGSPKGQFVYVWRGTYSGQPADFIIKSNALTSLSIVKISNTVYQATLQGKVNYSINSQATGNQLFGEGNDTFTSTVTDGDFGLSQPSSSADQFSNITFESGNVKLHPISTVPLIGGDVVVHR